MYRLSFFYREPKTEPNKIEKPKLKLNQSLKIGGFTNTTQNLILIAKVYPNLNQMQK